MIIILCLLFPGVIAYLYFEHVSAAMENNACMVKMKGIYDKYIVSTVGYVKTIVATLQIISSCPVTFQIAYPIAFTDFLQVFSVLNLDFVSILPFSCSYNIDFVDTLMVTTLAPIIFGACLGYFWTTDT